MRRVVAITLVSTVPAVLLLVQAYFSERDRLAAQTRQDATHFAEVTAAGVDVLFSEARRTLALLSVLPSVASGDWARCNSDLAEVLTRSDGFANLAVAAPDGKVVCSAVPPPVPVDFSGQDWFRRAVASRQAVVSGYQRGPITGTAVAVVAAPLLADGEVAAVVRASVDLALLHQIVSRSVPSGAAFLLIDRSGTVLFRLPDPRRWAGRRFPTVPIVRAALSGRTGLTEVRGIDGVERVWSITPLQSAGGEIVASGGIPPEVVFAVANRRLRNELLAAFFLFAFATAMATVLGKRFVAQPLRRITEGARRIAAGDYSARLGRDGTAEVADLAATFDEMARALDEREQAVAEARRRERSLLETASVLQASTEVAIIATDPKGLITLFNPGAERLLGYRSDEMVGKLTPAVFHDPAEVVARATEISAEPGFEVFVAAARRGEAETREWTYIRKDGSRVLVSLSVTAVRSGDGSLSGFLGVARDVSETRDALRRLEEASSLLQATLESAGEGVLAVDLAGRVTAWNHKFCQIWALPETVVASGSFEEVFETALPRLVDPAVARDLVEQATADPSSASETTLDLVDGKLVLCESRPQRNATEVIGRVWTFRDVSAERSAEAEIVAARKAAENANRAKSEFLSRMSHELRTPLNAILGFGQLLEMDDVAGEQREAVQEIMRAGRHLLDLVNEVLDLARIEARRLDLSVEPVAVADILAESAALVAPAAAARGITVELVGESEARYVAADRQRLKQVFINLLSNAVKYNHQGGRITVRCDDLDGVEPAHARLAVSDTGPGIAAERAHELFVPFERLGAGGEIEGTGLGLVLSRGLVEAMGGRIGFDSKPGDGSTFWVDLPRAEQPTSDRPGEVRRRSPEQPLSGTILYVEDNLANLRVVEHLLRQWPAVELVPAMQGRLGLELARRHVPDLILLDLHLPDIPGDEVLAALKSDPATADVPVVILSADVTSGLASRLLRQGAADHLSKPLDIPRLLEVIGGLLGEDSG